jgi:tRNA A-37 threonylcarbamoyl transferase component Bud32
VGQILNGRFLVQREIKRGGMGVVYLAQDQQLHSRPVVVKVLLDEAYQSDYVVQKFRQEVEALSRIDHPGIVGIIDSGELPNGRPFIVMQYVEGVTLRSVMSSEGMNLERVGGIVKQVGRALAAAHARGIFHRDLKPDNIMLQDLGHGEEQVKIIDFGVAKVKDSVVAPSTSLNLSPGTVAYMAPEQLSGRPITAATDIFALGAIAYEMITGRKPFNPETGFELLQMQQSGVRVKPADLRPSLSGGAQEQILKALAFDPSDRPAGPREFGDSLAQVLVPTAGEARKETKEPLPLTELSNEETPLAPGVQPAKTIPVPYQPAGPRNPSASELGFAASRSAGRNKKGLGIFVALGGLVLVAIIGFGAWYLLGSKSASETDKPAPPVSERNLSYALTVQKMRNGKPYQEPFESSGQEIFENGWKFRMKISSPQSGYLYLLNEGPAAGGEVTYNLLFPSPFVNSGSPYLSANQQTETGWMVFDEHQGTEKFWIVWAAEEVPELEAVKGVVNEKDKGTINDDAQANSVRSFLKKQSEPPLPEVEKDRGKRQTNLKDKGGVLVGSIELEHH